MSIEVSSPSSDNPFDSKSLKYYLIPELSQLLNFIHNFISNNGQLLLVLAKDGSGKTSLLKQLKRINYKHWWNCPIDGNTALSPEALISAILTKFNAPAAKGKSLPALQDSLRRHIAATNYNSQLPVLLIDDAHKLPLATLKFILELAEQFTNMRVILFSEPQLTSTLATPEFAAQQALIKTLDVPNFSPIQVRDYLQFRLQGSKYSQIHPFDSDTIKQISAESDGIVGKINDLAQKKLGQFAQQYESTLPNSLWFSKWLWGTAVGLILAGIALSLADLTSPSPTPTPHYQAMPKVSEPETTIIKPPVISELSIHAGANDAVVFTAPASSENVTIENEPVIFTAPHSHEETTIETEIKGEDWLLRQNPKAYTLQIMGVHDHITLKQFIAQHRLKELAMFKTTYRKKDWYVLVYGIYPTRQQALAALENLPASLRKSTQPWARSLGSVHKSIPSSLGDG